MKTPHEASILVYAEGDVRATPLNFKPSFDYEDFRATPHMNEIVSLGRGIALKSS